MLLRGFGLRRPNARGSVLPPACQSRPARAQRRDAVVDIQEPDIVLIVLAARVRAVQEDLARARGAGELRRHRESAARSQPDGLRGDVDVLVANILVGPVVALAPLFASYVKPGGSVCLSGVLETQTPAVIEAYEAAGFEALTRESEDGWAVVSGVRK